MALLSSRRFGARMRPVVVFWVAPCSSFRSRVMVFPAASACSVPSSVMLPVPSVLSRPDRRIRSATDAETTELAASEMLSSASSTTLAPVLPSCTEPCSVMLLLVVLNNTAAAELSTAEVCMVMPLGAFSVTGPSTELVVDGPMVMVLVMVAVSTPAAVEVTPPLRTRVVPVRFVPAAVLVLIIPVKVVMPEPASWRMASAETA